MRYLYPRSQHIQPVSISILDCYQELEEANSRYIHSSCPIFQQQAKLGLGIPLWLGE